jgi:thiamine biosynthesis protein ThiI
MKEHGIDAKVNHRWARIFVETEKVEEAIDVLRRIFGIVYFSPYKLVKLAELKEFVSENADRLLMGARTFAVRVRRTGKHDFTSMDLEREMGAILKERTGLKVSLKDPERTVFIEVRDEICFIYTDKIRGPGGLPLGTAGKVVCLISGGIDSPVAAWLMMRRGCSIISLFAHFPLGGDESDLRRFKKVVKLLKRWHIGEEMPVYLYRHEHNLVAFRKTAQNYTCVLCRRMMYRVAGELAKKLGARAIVTGENLAQVASQTLQNLYVIDKAVDLPVLRPLIGFEKDESITLAKHIGTYEASCTRVSTGCIPVKGCWARPKKPVTKAKEEVVAEHESKMSVEELLERSVRSLKEVQIA